MTVAVMAMGLTGCGGGGGGGGGSPLPPPSITAPSGTVQSTSSTVAIDLTIVDPSGHAVVTTWSRVSGPLGVSFASAAGEDNSVIFAANGTYLLRVVASNGSSASTVDIPVVVNDPAPFSLSGTVADGGSPAAGVPVRLLWSPVGEIGSGSTNGAGVASFTGLIGRKDRFRIAVGQD